MLTFYWYDRCSTCKKAKAWLDSHNLAYELKDLMTETPSAEQLAGWITESQLPQRRFFNTSGILYRERNLKDKVNELSLAEACAMLASEGKLNRRPLVIVDGHFFANGFKEEKYKELLG